MSFGKTALLVSQVSAFTYYVHGAVWCRHGAELVRPWCVPSRTIHGGVVYVPFREGTNRGVGVWNDPLCGSLWRVS